MLFNAWVFWAFFALVFGLYCVLNHRWQNRLLLVASYVFYGWWDWRFLSLMFISSVIDYTAGRKIASLANPNRRKFWLVLSMAASLTMLGFFKYFNFFVGSARTLAVALGLTVPDWQLGIILPVGISFYTFQTMSYAIDIYRRQLRPDPGHAWLRFLAHGVCPLPSATPFENKRHSAE